MDAVAAAGRVGYKVSATVGPPLLKGMGKATYYLVTKGITIGRDGLFYAGNRLVGRTSHGSGPRAAPVGS